MRSEIKKYIKKVLLLVSEQLYFNDVEANEVKTTTKEEILSFLFCDKNWNNDKFDGQQWEVFPLGEVLYAVSISYHLYGSAKLRRTHPCTR